MLSHLKTDSCISKANAATCLGVAGCLHTHCCLLCPSSTGNYGSIRIGSSSASGQNLAIFPNPAAAIFWLDFMFLQIYRIQYLCDMLLRV